MISSKHTIKEALTIAKSKKVYIEGNFTKLLNNTSDKEVKSYIDLCKEKDLQNRKKRLQVTKQVQKQNRELVAKDKQNDTLMGELKVALEEAKRSEEEAQALREEAEQGKEQALEDLEVLQKKTQFELVGTIVRIALAVIVGVGIVTSVMYGIAIVSNYDTQIIGSTWSNMFGILLTNAFSIVGTIMGVKYATEKE